jgi:hypothetical protein
MFLGHFGVALAAKRVVPGASLGTTMFAAQFLDALWPLFVLAGIEHFAIAPGITRVTPLDFTDYPWSHSLAMAVIWGAAFALVYVVLRRRPVYALWMALLVVSHWVLDWISHRPDLPLAPGGVSRHGLGLWDSLAATLVVELGLFAAGVAIYVGCTRPVDRIGAIAFWTLVALLLVAYAGAVFGPPPPSVEAVAWSDIVGYLFIALAAWADHHRRATGAES